MKKEFFFRVPSSGNPHCTHTRKQRTPAYAPTQRLRAQSTSRHVCTKKLEDNQGHRPDTFSRVGWQRAADGAFRQASHETMRKKTKINHFFFAGDTKDQKKSAGPSAETCPSPPASWFELSERSECTECMFTLPTPVLEVARGLGFWLQAWVGGAKKHMGDRRAPNPLWGKGRWTPTWPWHQPEKHLGSACFSRFLVQQKL